MNDLKVRKALLLAMIAGTAAAPLAFVDLDEPGTGLAIIKLLAKTGSLAGVVMMFWQLFLGFRGMLTKFIPDYIWIISLHKELGKYGMLMILLHPVFITVYYLRTFGQNVLLLEGESAFGLYVLFGFVALALLGVVVVTSLLRERMPRPVWYYLHLSSYLILPAVFVHSFPIGMTVRGTKLRGVWVALVLVLAAFYLFRLLERLGLTARKYQVTAAEKAAPNVTTITLRPIGMPMRPRFSQFAFVRRGLRGSARPFTVSGFDEQTGEICVTVGAVGRTSTGLQEVRSGEVMYLEGPFGVFGLDALAGDRPLVMIAGGIGITAFIRMLRHLSTQMAGRDAVLFYGSRTTEDILFKDELDTMLHVNVVHVISDDPDFEGETGYITLDLMQRHLTGDTCGYEFLLCGPPVMIHKLEQELRQAGVPAEQIHHELFGY